MKKKADLSNRETTAMALDISTGTLDNYSDEGIVPVAYTDGKGHRWYNVPQIMTHPPDKMLKLWASKQHNKQPKPQRWKPVSQNHQIKPSWHYCPNCGLKLE